MVEMNLDRDRPIHFDSKESEIQWERASALNALKLKAAVESGKLSGNVKLSTIWLLCCETKK